MEERSVEIEETIPASRNLGEDTARDLVASAKTITIAKGKRVDHYDGGTPTDEIIAKMLGSTGNLRAPTITVGDRIVVGYNEDVYREIFGD